MIRYEVSHCTEIPVIDGEAQFEFAKYAYEYFASKVQADARAVVAAASAEFGCAWVQKQETVTRAELHAAVESEDCGHWNVDRKSGLVWLDMGEREEVYS